MWGMFVIAAVVGTVFLFVPGYLFLRAMRLPFWLSLACAPLVSIACYSILSVLYGMLGVFCSWATVFVPVAVVSAVAFVATKKVSSGGKLTLACHDGVILVYVLVGVAVTSGVFLCQLSAPDAFVQSWDNVHHLDTVRGFVDSGSWTSLGTSLYLGEDAAIDPFVEGSFYPSGWHAFAAMIAGAFCCSVPFAINVANTVVIAVAFPLGACALLRTIFGERSPSVAAGSLFVMANASCPWVMLVWGPLYPNVMAYCLLPGVMAVFVALLSRDAGKGERFALGAAVVIGVVAFVFVQPNGVFTAVVLLAPYLVVRCYEMGRDAHRSSSRKIANAAIEPQELGSDDGDQSRRNIAVGLVCGLLAALVVVVFWLVAYNAPFLQSVVQYRWPHDSTLADALLDVVTQRFHVAGLSIGCALMLAAGIVSVFVRRRNRWLFFSWLLACTIYVVCVVVDTEWHQILAGFWYTDVPRVAAFAALSAVPLQALGLAEVCALVARPFAARKRLASAAAVVLVALVGVMLYAPIEASEQIEVGARSFSNASALHVQSARLAQEYSFDDPRVYDEKERAFVEEAIALMPEGALVVNEPNDGSAYAYGVDGLRTYYRYWRGYGDSEEEERPESALIRGRLNRIATDERVRAAVESTGVEYVLQLERGKRSWNTTMWTYRYGRLWRGIDNIDENTPGFELVLARDDMRLYKIQNVG